MKKILYVFLGMAISVLLYFGVIFIFINPIQRSSGHSPESYLSFMFMIILPLCIFLGSLISGYLIHPLLKHRSFIKYLLISPGFYLGLSSLIPTVIQAGNLMHGFIYFSIISSVVWLVTSVIGTRLGLFIKEKGIKNKVKHTMPK